MARNDYPLGAFRRQLEEQLDEARKGVATALDRRHASRQRLRLRQELRDRALASYRTARAEMMRGTLGDAFDVRSAQDGYVALEALQHQIDDRERTVQAELHNLEVAARRVAAARQQLLEAHRALDAVERHHETWRRRKQREQARREESERAELARGLWLRRSLQGA
ncbi:MAG: hypothetical protein AAGC60_01695 [Acidobacteriota bacterium]